MRIRAVPTGVWKHLRRSEIFLVLALGFILALVGVLLTGPMDASGSSGFAAWRGWLPQTLIGVAASLVGAAVVGLFYFSRMDRLQLFESQRIDFTFVDRARLGDDYWPNILRSATRHYRVLGMANHGYVSLGTRGRWTLNTLAGGSTPAT